MLIADQIRKSTFTAIQEAFPELEVQFKDILVNQTKPDFEGDFTVVLFPFVKALRKKPEEIGNEIGNRMMSANKWIERFNIISGFLNISVQSQLLVDFLLNHFNDPVYGEKMKKDRRIMVEYSSPNTNKPLHFGHLRNIFLGFSMAEILKANGNQVIKANLINDRGIHICKSMIAWQEMGAGATPESTGVKGDHLVGDYYVRFNDVYKKEMKELTDAGMDEKEAEKKAPIFLKAQDMLRAWEAGEPEVYALWETMNGWVYRGFDVTYKKLGINVDKVYHESKTYLLGKEIVQKGLKKGVLYQKEDGSIWVDLTDEGLDQKLLLRSDGTSVYMTQDLGTAVLKYNDFQLNQSIYVIADEQNYHMQVLQLILKKLGEPSAPGIYHLSYGMVELPTGKMKSREGTVVDADDMVAEMVALAEEQTKAAGKTNDISASALDKLYEMIGMGALKFYLLRVDPKKKMIFDPQESIDLHGFTATFIQYAHARICSILRKEELDLLPRSEVFQSLDNKIAVAPMERKLLLELEQYPQVIDNAACDYNPSLICNYAFQLAQSFNSFYDKHSIARAENEDAKKLRLMICIMVARTLRHAMHLLGINLPEKM